VPADCRILLGRPVVKGQAHVRNKHGLHLGKIGCRVRAAQAAVGPETYAPLVADAEGEARMPPPYVLDTDHGVAFLEPTHPGHIAVAQRIAATSAADPRSSLFTALELSEGPWHSQTPQAYPLARAAPHNFLAWVPLQPLIHISIEEFGRLRALFRRQGQMIEDLDLAVAATARAHTRTRVTHNTHHFRCVPGLMLEDWMP